MFRISALPTDLIVDEDKIIKRIMSINIVVGLVIACTLQPLPFLEGVSAHYTLTNLPFANQMLTATYTLYTVLFYASSNLISFYGRKMVKLIKGSLKFHQERAIQDKALIRQLKKSLGTIKPITLFATVIIGGGGNMCIVLAFARYYIWTIAGWSLLFHFLVTFFPLLGSSMLGFYLMIREYRLRRKYGPVFDGRGDTSSQPKDTKDKTLKTLTEEKSSEEVRLDVTKMHSTAGDVAMEEFMQARS